MIKSKSSLDYEIPTTFQYPLRKETINEKICKIRNKIFSFIRQHHVALAISLSSFLICQTVAGTSNSVSTLSTTVNNLENCQETLCNYWNDNIQRTNSNTTVKVNNLLSRLDHRCNTSDSRYKPFKSSNKCKRLWCKYEDIIGGKPKNCFDPLKTFIHLWNRLCPKKQFDLLKNNKQKKFVKQCFKKICNYYKAHNEKGNLNYYCESVKLTRIMQKIYKLLKDIQSELLKLQSYDSSGSLESSLAITASVTGTVAAIGSIVGTAVGCFVAKITMDSLRPVLPTGIRGVGEGLRNIVTGTIAFARRASLANFDQVDQLNIPSDREISRVSSQVDTLYQDALSSISTIEEDVREITYNFAEEEEQTLLQSNVIQESDIVNQHILENPVLEQAVIPYDNSFFIQSSGKVIEGAGQMVQKAYTKLSSLISDYREIIYMIRSENTQSFEILFESLDSILSNATKKVIQVAGAIIEPGINGSFRINGSEKIYDYNVNYTLDYSLNYTLLNQSTFPADDNDYDYIFHKIYRIFGKIVKRKID